MKTFFFTFSNLPFDGLRSIFRKDTSLIFIQVPIFHQRKQFRKYLNKKIFNECFKHQIKMFALKLYHTLHEYFRCPHLPVSLTHIAAATANIHYKNQLFILTLLSVSFNKFNFVRLFTEFRLTPKLQKYFFVSCLTKSDSQVTRSFEWSVL